MWMTVTTIEMTWPGADPNKAVKMYREPVSPEYFSTIGSQLKEGRGFYPDIKADSGDIIVNDSLAHMISPKSCIGSYLNYANRKRHRAPPP